MPPARHPCCDPGLPRRLPHPNFVHVITAQRLAARVTSRRTKRAITVIATAMDSGSRAIRLAPFRVHDRIPWTFTAESSGHRPHRNAAGRPHRPASADPPSGTAPGPPRPPRTDPPAPDQSTPPASRPARGIIEHIDPIRPPVPAPLHKFQGLPEPRMERVNHTHPLWPSLIDRFMCSRPLDRTAAPRRSTPSSRHSPPGPGASTAQTRSSPWPNSPAAAYARICPDDNRKQ